MTAVVRSKLPRVGTNIFTTMSQLATEHGAVNLGQGFPDFPTPQALQDALARHVAAGRNQYAPMTGVPRLREQIALKTHRLYGRAVDPDASVTVTSGATEALFAAVAASVDVDDEVILLDPCYDVYEPAVALQRARAVHVPLTLPSFAVDWERVKAALTPRTRLIVINSPHNPSGAVLERTDLDCLADILRGTDVVVLSDEVYEHIIFDGREHQSVLRHPELAERSFVVSSFGKTYHCTGWKVGYCIAPPALSAEFRKIHQYLTFATFTAAQHAFADILESSPQHYLDLPAFYTARRDRFRELLRGSRFELLPVGGAYFQVVDYGAISDSDDVAFCEWLVRDKGVAGVPVSVFYAEPPPELKLVRFCFAKTEATLAAAGERLRAV
ncbi:MAG TPA: pyridoxal phosphate-dependent aminotransferase [Chloroflexota bacterium]|nr:pyridoxal phosphate-dependent aminotransferase [Chloroflexota bacterium]